MQNLQFRHSKLHGLHCNNSLDFKWSKFKTQWHNNLVNAAQSHYTDELTHKDCFSSTKRDGKKEIAKRMYQEKIDKENILLVKRLTNIVKEPRFSLSVFKPALPKLNKATKLEDVMPPIHKISKAQAIESLQLINGISDAAQGPSNKGSIEHNDY